MTNTDAQIQLLVAWLTLISVAVPIVIGVGRYTYNRRQKEIVRWSHSQDDAIQRTEKRLSLAESKIATLRRRHQVVIGYTRRLIDILVQNGIDHPAPPDEFYADEPYDMSGHA